MSDWLYFNTNVKFRVSLDGKNTEIISRFTNPYKGSQTNDKAKGKQKAPKKQTTAKQGGNVYLT